jgi:hypothetical protein
VTSYLARSGFMASRMNLRSLESSSGLTARPSCR